MSEQQSDNKLVPYKPTKTALSTQIRAIPQNLEMNNAEENEREVSFSDLFRAIKNRWRLILSITAAFTIVMFIFCQTQAPRYTAASTIEIRGYAPVLAGASVENLFGADTRKLEYQKTTIAKLKHPGIADRVLSRDERAAQIAEYFSVPLQEGSARSEDISPLKPQESRQEGLQQIPRLLALYLTSIDINPVRDTSLAEISVTTRDPKISMIIANAHASGFIEDLRLERQDSMRANISALEAQVNELREKLAEAEEAIATYSEENNLIVLPGAEQKDVTLQKIVGLSQLLADATAKRLEKENLYDQLKTLPLSTASSLDNEAINQLRYEYNQLARRHKVLGKKVTAEYPEMLDLTSKLESIEEAIAGERAQLRNSLAIKLEVLREGERRLTDKISEEESRVHDNLKSMARYIILRKEADSLRQLYEAVLKQLQETTVSAASGVSNIFVSDWASEPQFPSYPRKTLLIVIATMVGLGVGLLTAWIFEYFDNRIKTADEAAFAVGLPLLGVLPKFDEIEDPVTPSKKPPLQIGLDLLLGKPAKGASASSTAPIIVRSPVAYNLPDAIVSEALRTIRAGLLLSSIDKPVKTVMITSASKGEGKSTIAANLAISLAQAEYRTLLIDADMRESSIANFFPEVIKKPGLSDLMAGQSSSKQAILRNILPNLDILGSGTRPPNPSEILGSKKLKETLNQLRELYDFIIIDSPPVLPVADSLMLSHIVDGVLLVTRADKTVRRNAQDARRRLGRAQANIIGLIVNGTNARNELSYGYLDNSAYYSVANPNDFPTDTSSQSSANS